VLQAEGGQPGDPQTGVWPSANDKNARLQLICTQALHWAAFLFVMSMMLLPNVQRIVCTENLIRVDQVMELAKLAE
jgi:hypothetical protein